MNILILCTGNSERSIMLEHILAKYGYNSHSAGSKALGRVHPQTLQTLKDFGYSTTEARSKSWDEFTEHHSPKMDLVITVCGDAANEECPIWPGMPIRGHWGVDDPACAPQKDQPRIFKKTFQLLNRKALAFIEFENKIPLKVRLLKAAEVK